MDTLPDELVREILTYVLLVSDDDFDSPCLPPVFGRLAMSSSVILLVSKRWLQIATPLLYECVVLRNTPQKEAFYRMLKGKNGLKLKRFVRRMRIEAISGVVAKKILAAVSSITDLFFHLPIRPDERVDGIVEALPKLSPRRVIFDFHCRGKWKNILMLTQALVDQVQRWTSLVEFKLYLSVSEFKHASWYTARKWLLSLCCALNGVSSLRSLTLIFADHQALLLEAPLILRTVGDNPLLRAVHIFVYNERNKWAPDKILSSLRDHPRASIFHCSVISHSDIRQSPMHSPDITGHVPQLPKKVLRRIIDMHLESFLNDGRHSTFASFQSLSQFTRRYRDRCTALMTVSREFCRNVLPFTFRFVPIVSPSCLSYAAGKLTDGTDLGPSVEGLLLCDRTKAKNTFKEDKARALVDNVMKYLPNLQQILVTSDTAFALDSIRDEVKIAIEHLSFEVTSPRINQAVLYQFANLTHLTLVGVNVVNLNVEIRDERVRPCFRSVNSVTIEEARDMSVIRALRSCDFPVAESLQITFSTLDVEDECELSSELMPRFPALRFFYSRGLHGPYAELLRVKNCNVEIIKMRRTFHALTRPEKASLHEHMIIMFSDVELSNLKALKEVQLADVEDWPWEDHLLKDTSLHNFAQSLIDTYGFKITNEYGVPWRPRLLLLPKNRATKAKSGDISTEK